MSMKYPGRDARHPRRRPRPGLPPPRERAGPVRIVPRQAVRHVLDAQRPDAVVERSRQGRRPQHARQSPTAIRQRKKPARSASRTAPAPSATCSDDIRRETIRFFLLSTHYRRPIDFSDDRLAEVEHGLDSFYRFFERYERVTGESFYQLESPRAGAGSSTPRRRRRCRPRVAEHPRAVSRGDGRRLQHRRARSASCSSWSAHAEPVRRQPTDLEGAGKQQRRRAVAIAQGRQLACSASWPRTLGLFRRTSRGRETMIGRTTDLTGPLMELLIELRAEARKDKNFALADQIRKRLTELGVTLEDRPDGTDWTIQK